MKKLTLLVLLLLVTMFEFVPAYVLADGGSVVLSGTVVARKPTDTINDFDLSSINPIEYDLSLPISRLSGEVKGASTVDGGGLARLIDSVIRHLKFWI